MAPRLLAAAAAGVLAAAVGARAQTWYGLTPHAASPGGAVDVVVLTDGGKVTQTVGTVGLAPGEVTWPDGFRCIRGFCLFAATTFAPGGGGAPVATTLYNVSAADATVLSRSAPCPGACRDVHVDYRSGRVFVTSIVPGKSVVVTEVPGGGAPLVPVIDVTTIVRASGGSLYPGMSTHCSEDGPGGHLFLGVTPTGGAAPFVLDIDLAAGEIAKTIPLGGAPPLAALWARCDGSGGIGGLSFVGAGGANATASFGTVDTAGGYTPGDTMSVPPGYVPTGLLTGTEDATINLAVLFPPGTPTNATGVAGFTWAVSSTPGGSEDALTPVGYYLIGAAMDTPPAAA
jgi:hypothetical protein